RQLEAQALALKLSGQDTKWVELESILDAPEMFDAATGLRRKILIFTEPKDTLNYLHQKIVARTGSPESVVVIHGGIPREARRGGNRRLQFGSGGAGDDRQRRRRRGRQ